jgi:hypothetical protein
MPSRLATCLLCFLGLAAVPVRASKAQVCHSGGPWFGSPVPCRYRILAALEIWSDLLNPGVEMGMILELQLLNYN